MTSSAVRPVIPHFRLEQLREARAVLRTESAAIDKLADGLDEAFCDACDRVRATPGTVIVTGMGKAGLIGAKIAATLSSTGTPARFLHPAEAVHGDVGAVQAGDVAVVLSNSGETDEVCRLLPILRQLQVSVIAVTARADSSLGSRADVVIPLGDLREAGQHGLAPTTSTAVMLALGDALALVVSKMKGFTPRDFALFHPAGSLGHQLRSVSDAMRSGDALRIAAETSSVRAVFVQAGKPGRRSGAVMLVDRSGRLTGLFTDSDLARLLETRRDDALDRPICEVMTREPLTASPDMLLLDVIGQLSQRKLSEVPVVDARGRPVGLIDITDLIGLMPRETACPVEAAS